MIIRSFAKVLMVTTDAVAYFALFYFGVRFVFNIGFKRAPMTELLFIFIPGILLLWSFSYLGTWIILAERKRASFLKYFILVDICPGLLGALVAVIRFLV